MHRDVTRVWLTLRDSRTFSEDDPNLQRSGFNDTSSSAVIDGGRWELCADAGFQGKCVALGRGRYASLRDLGLNDSVSSVRRASSRSGRDDSARSSRERYDDARGDPEYRGDGDTPPQVSLGRNRSVK